MLSLKRAYDPPAASDGTRILVDRLWPRGVTKEALKLDHWLKDVAPSPELRKWFGHDPARWDTFQRRYVAELNSKHEICEPILEIARKHRVTLVYGARDPVHNHALVLKAFLDRRL